MVDEHVEASVRADMATAVATGDGQIVADALVAAAKWVLNPVLMAGFVYQPGEPVELRRFVVDPAWTDAAAALDDLSWMQPLLGSEVVNGASLIGPEIAGATQVAATMDLGLGRYSYFLVLGEFGEPERAREQLAMIAAVTGESTRTVRAATERVADSAALLERERLSRDLHDSLSQSLWSLSMLSETAQSMIDADDPVHDVVRQITDRSLAAQEEMRSLLINLRTVETSSRTLADALESLAHDFRESHDIEVIVSAAEVELDDDSVTAFQRIAEEALNNIGRHAKASRAVVLFDAYPSLSLRITDDGVGFDANPAEGHLGLRIMRERAKEVGCAFEIQSKPGSGTAVEVSVAPSKVTPIPLREAPVELPSTRRALRFLAAGLVFAAFTLALVFLGVRQNEAVQQAEAELDLLTVLESRVVTSRAAADEMNTRILFGVGAADAVEVTDAVEARFDAIERARPVVEPLATPGSVVGENALSLLGEFELLTVSGLTEAELLDTLYLYAGSWEGLGVQSSASSAAPMHALGNLVVLDQAVTLSLLESVAGRYAMEPDSYQASAGVDSFLLSTSQLVRDAGGYLGPDPVFPLRNGYIPSETARVHEADAEMTLNRIVGEARLWDDDQWLRNWTVDAGPPPTGLSAYVDRSTTATDAVRQVIDERIDAHGMRIGADRDRGRNGRMLFGISAALAGLVAAAALAWSLRTVLQRARLIAADSTIDPLTRLGNRKLLEERVAPALADPQLTHHVVVAIDMDRFKFINDAHGHGFGDRLLEVVGVGLKTISEFFEGVTGSAIRLGGDEFLLTFHSDRPIPADDVRRILDRLRRTMVSADDGTMVRCGFSYGLVEAEGSPELDSLMTASDFAAYEDKARLGDEVMNS